MHTGRRDQLHLSKIEEFTAWAEDNGYVVFMPKGEYEVLRLRNSSGRLLIFWRHHAGDHVTTDKYSQPLVDQWMREKRKRCSGE